MRSAIYTLTLKLDKNHLTASHQRSGATTEKLLHIYVIYMLMVNTAKLQDLGCLPHWVANEVVCMSQDHRPHAGGGSAPLLDQ